MSARSRLQQSMRVRREQPTRLEGFVDASFAFAVTLVVISIGRVPASVPDMLQALRGVPTFAVCFVLIARMWKSHRDWSRHYDLEDGTAVALSIGLVFLVLIYVYPLRLLFALMFAGLSGGRLMDQPVTIGSAFELRAAFAVFGIGYAAIWLVLASLYRHALRARASIGLDAAEIAVTRFRIRQNVAFAAVALLSVAAAAVLPFDRSPWLTTMPGTLYLLMIPIAAALRGRCVREIDASPPAPA